MTLDNITEGKLDFGVIAFVLMFVLSSVLSVILDLLAWIFGLSPDQYESIARHLLKVEVWTAAYVLIIAFVLSAVSVGIVFLTKNIPSVFLSYHHSNYDNMLEMAARLSANRIKPLYVEFLSNPSHDALLDSIYPKIQEVDFFACLPGTDPSFVESEISHAIAGGKSIFIVLPRENRGSPNTSQKSYPVLCLEQLRDENFWSIGALIRYLYGDWRETVSLICGSTGSTNSSIGELIKTTFIFPIIILLGAVVASFSFSVLGYELLRLKDFITSYLHIPVGVQGLYTFAFLIPCFVGTLLVATWGHAAHAAWVRWKARLIVRRQIERGTYSFQSLNKLFEYDDHRRLLVAFFQHAPSAHHEVFAEQERQERRPS